MALLGFGKNKKKKEAPACCGTEEASSCCCGENAIQNLKVLGAGCKACHALLESTQTAVKTMGLPVEVEYVTDMEKIAEYGVMSMPALVVNEQVVSMGKVLKAADVERLLHRIGY